LPEYGTGDADQSERVNKNESSKKGDINFMPCMIVRLYLIVNKLG